MNYISPIVNSLEIFVSQILLVVPKLIVAYIIWLLGKWGIRYAVKAIDLLDIKKWKFDDHARDAFKAIFVPTAKILLILIILDTLGIGQNFIGAIINSVTFAVAIALGLSFGKALEPDAQHIVDKIKRGVHK